MSPPGTYFVTTSTAGKRAIIGAENLARVFLKTLYHYRREGAYLLHEFVLMPDHCHLIFTPTVVTLERAMQLIKGGSSHRLKSEGVFYGEVWQRGFTDHRIRDAEDYAARRVYVLNNPVKRHLAASPEQYRYCSAYPGYKSDPWPSAAKAVAAKAT
jgi:putative transposase